MTDPFEAVIYTFCLQMVSDNSLRNEILTSDDHLSEIRDFKKHLQIAHSNFDPSLNQTNL